MRFTLLIAEAGKLIGIQAAARAAGRGTTPGQRVTAPPAGCHDGQWRDVFPLRRKLLYAGLWCLRSHIHARTTASSRCQEIAAPPMSSLIGNQKMKERTMNKNLRTSVVVAALGLPALAQAGGLYLYEVGTSDSSFYQNQNQTVFAIPSGATWRLGTGVQYVPLAQIRTRPGGGIRTLG